MWETYQLGTLFVGMFIGVVFTATTIQLLVWLDRRDIERCMRRINRLGVIERESKS
jgi:hypothetical protein